MIHIVFNQDDVKVLEQVIELDESLQGSIMQIQDDYAVGPLLNCFETEGIEARYNWWGEVLTGTEYYNKWQNKEVDDYATVEKIKAILNENEEELIWIWCAQNKHDVSGYYWLMSQLKDYQSRVFILYLNNLPFINEKGNIFYPEWISQILPSEFLKAKKLARPITLSEFEVDPDEWTKLCNENKGIRLLEGGKKLVQEEIDFYDTELKSFITTEFQKVNKIINTYLSKSKHTTGDTFLLWRIREMLQNGQIEAQGENGKQKDFEVKKRTAVVSEA